MSFGSASDSTATIRAPADPAPPMPTLLHRFGRFAVVGALATATHAAVFAAAIEAAHVEPVLATALAFVVAMLTGFALNRRWTSPCRDAAHSGRCRARGSRPQRGDCTASICCTPRRTGLRGYSHRSAGELRSTTWSFASRYARMTSR
jgi:hypothetical protein